MKIQASNHWAAYLAASEQAHAAKPRRIKKAPVYPPSPMCWAVAWGFVAIFFITVALFIFL